MPVVLTYGGWAGGRAYVHMITKISRMGRLPHFLRYGATLTREALECSSAISFKNRAYNIRGYSGRFNQPAPSTTLSTNLSLILHAESTSMFRDASDIKNFVARTNVAAIFALVNLSSF